MDQVGAPDHIEGQYNMGLSAKTSRFMADQKVDGA